MKHNGELEEGKKDKGEGKSSTDFPASSGSGSESESDKEFAILSIAVKHAILA